MDNKTKTDRIHDLIPKVFKSRTNTNWAAVVASLGDSDETLSALMQEVRKQFFVKTASRPYIDRLGSNVKVSRPRLVGMDDSSFRDYVPVLAYQPKQVKLVIDKLLDIFFFKESTTAFAQSDTFAPFALENGWALDIKVDNTFDERITFNSDDFTDIAAATADEVVGAYNRQAQHTFAVTFDDRIQKQKFVRIFSQTVGAKGSIEIAGGLANKALQFGGYNNVAGSKSNTAWTITKTGDTMTFTYLSGDSPGVSNLQIGDIAIINIPDNLGSFYITDIDAGANSFSFINVFGTAGGHDHTGLSTFVNFLTPEKTVIYTRDNRAVTWEVTPGEIIIEMPASPPVVKRDLKGSAHVNSEIRTMSSRDSDTSMTIDDVTDIPTSGQFILQERQAIVSRISTLIVDEEVTQLLGTRFDKQKIYSYTGISGSQLTGITPNLPTAAQNYQTDIVSSTRTGNDTANVTTVSPHGFAVGESVAVQDTVNGTVTVSIDGTAVITSVPTTTTFTYISIGDNGTSTGGTARVERVAMASSGSLVHLSTANVDTGVIGPYIWDLSAAFVLSELTSKIQAPISAGQNVRTLPIESVNNIPNEEGFIIFNYGTELQEGPVRYLYKPTDASMQLDPAYIFQFDHAIGSSVTVIRNRGPIAMSGTGLEYAPYITSPAIAREVLQDLIQEVKSVGIFLEFLIRFPEQLYATLDVYESGNEALWPVSQS
jgi:hypothetical protein